MKKAIITVVGKDTVGIIAKVFTFLAEKEVNTLDITQSIIDGYFTMMAVVDVTNIDGYDEMVSGLGKLGEEMGVEIRCQRAEIFESMHRI